jgi:hypothetical protein
MRRESLEALFHMDNLDGILKQALIGKLLQALLLLIRGTAALGEECRSEVSHAC